MFEATILVSIGCSVLGLSLWNFAVQRSLQHVRAQQASQYARSEAMLLALGGRLTELEQFLDARSVAPISDTSDATPSELNALEYRAVELAAAGVDRKKIADRLKMRKGDIELLFKLSEYRKKANEL